MALNKIEGEVLGDIGRGLPVPTEKWAGVCDMLHIASNAAYKEMLAMGLAWDFKFGPDNVLVMEYHGHNKVVFLFWVRINGQDRYYHYTFELGQAILSDLQAANAWPAIIAPPNRLLH